ISMLVLAANPGAEGPGPIITTMAKTVGSFPIPLVIISGALSDAEVDGLS
ncbi:MAG: universal stress protein, partial [Bradyrhizobium icense]